VSLIIWLFTKGSKRRCFHAEDGVGSLETPVDVPCGDANRNPSQLKSAEECSEEQCNRVSRCSAFPTRASFAGGNGRKQSRRHAAARLQNRYLAGANKSPVSRRAGDTPAGRSDASDRGIRRRCVLRPAPQPPRFAATSIQVPLRGRRLCAVRTLAAGVPADVDATEGRRVAARPQPAVVRQNPTTAVGPLRLGGQAAPRVEPD
jgi:hypothetical protein